MATLPESSENPYILPNRYAGNKFDDLFREIFAQIYYFEKNIRRPDGGNLVLNGVKGLGKTTILHGSGILAACLTRNVMPTYWIHEKHKSLGEVSPTFLAKVTKSLFLDGTPFPKLKSFDAYVEYQLLNHPLDDAINCSKVLFLLDEFTTLYLRPELGSVYQFRDIARQGDEFFILATSVINVRKFIYPTHDEVKNDPVTRDYPNLNQSLFEVREIRAMRTLSAFLSASYSISDKKIANE